MFRHGDLLIIKTEQKKDLKVVKTGIVEEGEVTGHAHRITGDGGTVLIDQEKQTKYIQVVPGGGLVELVHEEHDTITIPPGWYEVIRQREHDPYLEAVRYVQD